MARILLYSQQPILAKGLAAVLSTVAELDLVCVCAVPERVIDTLLSCEPDLLLIDWNSEITLEALVEARKRAPRCKIVLWVLGISPELAYQTIRLGVHGILRKTLSTELALRCLQKVCAGEYWFEEALAESFTSAKAYNLSRREGELVSLLSQGLKNKEIATALAISEGTVKVYLSKLFRKVGVKDRYELALQGLKNTSTGQERFPTPPPKPERLPLVVVRAAGARE